MNRATFLEVLKMAQEHKYNVYAGFEEAACEALGGMEIDKNRRFATREQAAWLINYQCRYLNGQYDTHELEKVRELYKRVDLIN